jgi:hypothetical protein
MNWIWIVIAVCVFDLAMTAFIISIAVRRNWEPLMARFPRHEPRPDALVRRHQSFSIGILNLGWSVHVAADDGHLHLTTVRWMQRLGARPVSIPWEAIEIKTRRPGGRYTTVKVGALTMRGPAWCLDLAEPETPEPAGHRTS